MVMAGGTGGHVFPGLAVAEQLRRQGVGVFWLGTHTGLEARAVPAAGFDVEWVSIRGLRRKGLMGWLLLPMRLLIAMFQSLRVIRRRRPDVVLAMGGYTAGPGGLVAWMLRRPLLIHEQNAVPGLTNRWLALLADYVLCGFPGAFGTLTRTRHVGNPVRQSITAVSPPERRTQGELGSLHLLVVGGSQGAQVFNDVVPQAMHMVKETDRPQVRHQCGERWVDQTRSKYQESGTDAEVSAFIQEMAAAYEWADLVICRAGAMTIAELSVAGCASVLVPFPYAVDDHQTANARFLVDRNAAVLLPQNEFTPSRVAALFLEFNANREVLKEMAQHARGCAVPDAAETVARYCLEAVNA